MARGIYSSPVPDELDVLRRDPNAERSTLQQEGLLTAALRPPRSLIGGVGIYRRDRPSCCQLEARASATRARISYK